MEFKSKKEVFARSRITRVNPEYDKGLTSMQVRERLAGGWDNRPVESPTKTVKQIITSNVFTYFNIIFFVIAFALILVGSFNNLSFLVINRNHGNNHSRDFGKIFNLYILAHSLFKCQYK